MVKKKLISLIYNSTIMKGGLMGVYLDNMNKDPGKEGNRKQDPEAVQSDQRTQGSDLPEAEEKDKCPGSVPEPALEPGRSTETDGKTINTIMEKLSSIEKLIDGLGQKGNQAIEGIRELNEKETRFEDEFRKSISEKSEISDEKQESGPVSQNIEEILKKQINNDRMLVQVMKDNTAFQIQVRQGMKQELDAYKEQESGKQFNSILEQIAAIYVEYGKLILGDDSLPERTASNLHAMFDALEEILDDYDAEIIRTDIGKPCPSKHVKIVEKIPTSDESLHRLVVASRNPGVIRDKSTLYPERVDVYVYDPDHAPAETDSVEQTKESEGSAEEEEVIQERKEESVELPEAGTEEADEGTEDGNDAGKAAEAETAE